jgi:hypothetical protein
MLKKYLPVLAVILSLMAVWWRTAVISMVTEVRIADITLFLTIGVASSVIGCLIVFTILKKNMGRDVSYWNFVICSSFVSTVALWLISLKLIKVMTIT